MLFHRATRAFYFSFALFARNSTSLFLNSNRSFQSSSVRIRENYRYAAVRTRQHFNGSNRSVGPVSVRLMSVDAETVDVATNLKSVEERVRKASEEAGTKDVRLVAVSKTKPIELLDVAYGAGCRYFGENYMQELVEKIDTWKDRSDVNWHFIGGLQSNKCNALVKSAASDVSRLTVETVASTKVADKLNNAVTNLNTDKKLKVFVQVNTSGETSKSGVEPGDECVDLCLHIAKECECLEFRGLMTIGAVGDLNCFQILKKCQGEVKDAFEKNNISNTDAIELSMGMSADFEEAIMAGATSVRVGSTIFGERDYSNKK